MCISLSGARQRLGKHLSAVTNKHNNRRIVGGVVFYMVRVVSKESMRLVLPRTFCYVYKETAVFSFRSKIVCLYIQKNVAIKGIPNADITRINYDKKRDGSKARKKANHTPQRGGMHPLRMQ
jgi:hypothetical protein